MLGSEGDERWQTPAPAPHPCEHLLTGWFRCYWLCQPTSPNGHDRYHNQWPQHQHHTTDDTPPTPSPMSNCSWGGSWVKWQQQGRRTTNNATSPTPRGTTTPTTGAMTQAMGWWWQGWHTTTVTGQIQCDTHPPMHMWGGEVLKIISFVASHPLAIRVRGQYLIVLHR